MSTNSRQSHLALIDSIDHAIIDLVPESVSSEQISTSIDELLDRTLAKHQSQSEAFKKTLHAVFRLRGASLQQSIPRESWAVLKKSGATPRFWKAVNQAELLANPLWQTLDNPVDPAWRDQIVLPLLAMTEVEGGTPAALIVQVIEGWLSGRTYAEIAQSSGRDTGDILAVMCEEIGFRLQDSASKLAQLALAQHGVDNISETAQAWPSLLQYGLGTMQQLDLCERGATERLAVWGIQRFLTTTNVELRGWRLARHLRRNGPALRMTLAADERVPRLCADRIYHELRIAHE